MLAGITTGILAVPQGIAFALIAHVPPEHGLYAMIVPTIVAALDPQLAVPGHRGDQYLRAGDRRSRR